MMDALMLFYPTLQSVDFIVLGRRSTQIRAQNNVNKEHQFHSSNILRTSKNVTESFNFVLFYVHQYCLGSCLAPRVQLWACTWMLLASIAKCCLLSLSFAGLFPFPQLVAKSHLHMQIV